MTWRTFPIWLLCTTVALSLATGGCPTTDTGDSANTNDNQSGQDTTDGTAQTGPAGAAGTDGTDGTDGDPGPQGPIGLPGDDGLACWDLNGNGVFDVATEDSNGNGIADADDCQGASGAIGLPGLHCWDLNANGVFDVATEDVNGNGIADSGDCQGGTGDDGLNCWDLNGNGIFDANEDVNGDGFATAADCQSAGSVTPEVVARGTIPLDGAWDPANGFGILSVDHDLNDDQVPDTGVYRIEVAVDNALGTLDVADLAIVVSPQSTGQPPAQLFGFWNVVSLTNTILTVDVEFRTAPLNLRIDANFGFVVFGP